MATMFTRYEIGNPWEQEHARTFAHAEVAVRRILRATPDSTAYIFDRMAKYGAIECTTYAVKEIQTHIGKAYQYQVVTTRRRVARV